MRFIVDANLPSALARWLIESGEIAAHVAAGGMFGRTDASIWDEALATVAVIVTLDDDFARRRSVTRTGPQIVWVRHWQCAACPSSAPHDSDLAGRD